MSAAIAAASSTSTSPSGDRVIAPFPTRAALALEQASRAELERAFVRGSMPDLEGLVGWEFRGINRLPLNALPIAQLIGIKKFMKGFFRAEDGRVMGYNCPIAQNVLDGRWHAKPDDAAPKRFGFYEVRPVDATERDTLIGDVEGHVPARVKR